MTDTTEPVRPEALLAHAGWLRGFAAAIVADPQGADDVVQETWLAALTHPPADARSRRRP